MKLAIWLVVIVGLATAATLTVVRYEPATSALRQAIKPGALSPGHAFLGDRCASCHVTSVGVTAAKCTTCHANAERLLGRQPTAFHASIPECASCHVEHQRANTTTRPIAMDHVALARIGAQTLARASRTDAASAATLASLETWLRIRVPGQLDASSTREALNCVGCHATKDRHVGMLGTDCAQCHATTQWTIAKFRHPSSRSTSCAQCHKPPPSHSMMHFNMVSKRVARQEDERVTACCGTVQVNQCYRCHQTTSWNDILGVGYYKIH